MQIDFNSSFINAVHRNLCLYLQIDKALDHFPKWSFVSMFILNWNLFILTYLNCSSNRHSFYHIVLKIENRPLTCLKPILFQQIAPLENTACELTEGAEWQFLRKTLSFHHCQPTLGLTGLKKVIPHNLNSLVWFKCRYDNAKMVNMLSL